MASLELVDHTQDLKSWHLPQQQHGVRQPPAKAPSDKAAKSDRQPSDLTAE